MNVEQNISLESSKQWFKEAELGLFVHWGLYSVPAGEWKGRSVPWFGEWIMNTARIPIREYEVLTKKFNPTEFNARQWVDLAEQAGMRYIVFTAKHHDGFAMYKSQVDRFNIVDSTSFGRDPIEELAKACSGTNVKLALYYSQAQDWHEPSAGNSAQDEGYGNTWDFPPGTPEGFSRYMEKKAKPQIKELLTQYGPIAMMWFDNPIPSFNFEHAKKVKELVRGLQPGCLINARIGHGLGDIRGWGDYYIPREEERCDRLSEACISMNETWGYKKNGGLWTSAGQLIENIWEARLRGYNLLINVGPMSNGKFPPEAILRLEQIARAR